MFKPLDRTQKQPIYLQIHQQIRDLILNGDLSAGTRLPSERDLATIFGVNRTTVSKAYQELYANGLVEGQVGRGTVVRPILEEDADHPFPWLDYFASVGRQSQDPLRDVFVMPDQKHFISFAYGMPDPALHPVKHFAHATDLVLQKQGATAFEFNRVEPFEQTLIDYVREQGISASLDHILVLTGSQQGLDLIARAFLSPGDTVVVASPTYVGALGIFREAGVKFIEIPLDGAGLRTDILEHALRRHTPRLIYTMPTFQNPSGAVMSMERRQHLLALAQKYDVPIVEDDSYREFYYDQPAPPSLKSLDRTGHVIYLSTFTNTLFSGVSLGWMIAPRPVVQRLETIKQFSDLFSNTFFQWVMIEFIERGWYEQHLAQVRSIYAIRYDAMIKALQEEIPRGLNWHEPKGGFFIWCWLDDHFRAKDLLAEAKQHQLFFVTGEVFHGSQAGHDTFRLNFTYHSEDTIQQGIWRLGQAVRAFHK